jgi:K+-sensing histidine kinase KdpD
MEQQTPLEMIPQLPKRSRTVVCVTDQLRCDRIIRSGRKLADLTDTDLVVINVCTPQRRNDPGAMEYLFRVASEYGGEMAVLYSPDVTKTIIRYIKENHVSYVVTGIPQENDSVITRIWKKFTHITFFMVAENGELCEATRPLMQTYLQKRA